ncbi:hypothetical protein Droror1_Dr00022597 [Drosera rotundifolia]
MVDLIIESQGDEGVDGNHSLLSLSLEIHVVRFVVFSEGEICVVRMGVTVKPAELSYGPAILLLGRALSVGSSSELPWPETIAGWGRLPARLDGGN